VVRKAKGQRKRRGQFFIPGHLSDAMAQMFDPDDPDPPGEGVPAGRSIIILKKAVETTKHTKDTN
jgi:hypothetical protein